MLRPIPLFPGRGCARRSADLIRRSDFSDVAEVPEEFTENQLRDAHNDIVRRLRPGRVIASALVAALASPLFGGLVVETHAKGSWPNTSNVVTSVSWEGGTSMDTNSVRGVVDSSFAGGTNAVNAAVAAVGSMSNSWNRVAETVGSMSNSWNRAGSDATNYTDSATNALRLCDGAARPLPKYLHAIDFADSYPDAAQEYYRSRGNGKADGGCSAVRDGGFLYRNFDYPFDDRAEFVVKMSAGPNRFASVGVAQVGTNLTEQMVTSGKPSKWYKALPGSTVDGINENGVVAEINVVDGPPQWRSGVPAALKIHPLAAVRWSLDNGTSAAMVASNLAARIAFPAGWTQNFHYMVADATSTYIVENGTAYPIIGRPVMTNFRIAVEPPDGPGVERYNLLMNPANSITNAWYTRAYHRETNPPWVSDLKDVLAYTNDIFDAWATHPKEYFRGKTNNDIPWRQSVHTSVYDITNRVLHVAVQETDDWYTFQVPVTAPKIDAYTKAETDAKLAEKIGGGDVPSFEQDPTVGLTNGTIHIKGQTITPITEHQDVSGFVPYTLAKNDVDLGLRKLSARTVESVSAMTSIGGYIVKDSYRNTVGTFVGDGFLVGQNHSVALPYGRVWGSSSSNDLALVSQIEDATNGIPEAIDMAVKTNEAGVVDGGNISVGAWRLNNERGLEYNETINIKAEIYPDDNYLRMGEHRPNESEFKFFAHTDEIPDMSNVVRTNEYGTATWRVAWDSESPFIRAMCDSRPTYNIRQVDLEIGGIVIRTSDIVKYIGWPYSHGFGDDKLALVSQIEAATNGLVSASNPAFADAVKSVAISWDISSVTNAVAALNDFKAAFGDLGAGDIVGGAGTLGGIILALIGAVTWLKKNKADKGDIPALKGQTFDLSKDAEFKLMCVAVAKALGATVIHINPIDDNTTGNDVASMYGITPTDATTYGDIETRAGLSDTDTPEDL